MEWRIGCSGFYYKECKESVYSEQEIKQFANSIAPAKQQVYVYFNNTWGTAAPTNARQLLSLK